MLDAAVPVNGTRTSKKRFRATDKTRYACRSADCGFIGTSFRDLKKHEYTTHVDERPYPCPHEGCIYRSKQSRDLSKHIRTHTGERPYQCEQEGCIRSFAVLSALRLHERAQHGTDANVLHCEVEGCDYQTPYPFGMSRHMWKHTGEKPYRCVEEDCDFETMYAYVLQIHNRRHRGERLFACTDEHCDAAFYTQYDADQHYKAWHSTEAALRHKRKESRVAHALKEAGVRFEREVHIDYRCFGGAHEKQFARIDFVIYTDRCVFLLEVDEHQHHEERSPWDYTVACDMSRMGHVQTALTIGNGDNEPQPIVWLRYNPDTFFVDHVRRRVLKRHREERLLQIIREYLPPEGAPLSILYFFYDCRTHSESGERVALVTEDQDYDATIAACVDRVITE